MPTTTTNFGWTVPSDTDLVKDGAAAIRTALGGPDASFIDLKGGTTGQVLSKASGTDLDYSWTTISGGGLTLINSGSTSKGLLIYMYGVTNTVTNSLVYMQVNSDSTSGNYPHTAWWANVGSSGGALNSQTTTYIELDNFGQSYWGNNVDNFTVINMPSYQTATVKSIDYAQSQDLGSTARTNKMGQVFYRGTSAISSITITSTSSFSGGTLEVYGVN
jgi:hypothetical protein